MHPLRFPNNGIRAKIFVRKIGFKLRVMRLYRVKSFYGFLLPFYSKGSEEEGRLAKASPYVGLATHGQGQPEREANCTCKGRRLRAEALPAGGCRPCGLVTAGCAAPVKGIGYRAPARAVAASAGAAATQKGKEGLGHPLEKRMILPL
ncbi:hypothetical protein B296_00040252 [Ensete ventricosum]|uniref:Uncharacterized protein n=1 Tax=Ensete ventricosum TaxID=4639 RepID=A0A426X3Z4_ENSVE|nr:hypothetical protein B296_00040252 [Ensete ventricosum]